MNCADWVYSPRPEQWPVKGCLQEMWIKLNILSGGVHTCVLKDPCDVVKVGGEAKRGYKLMAGFLQSEESKNSKFESSFPSCYEGIFVKVGG